MRSHLPAHFYAALETRSSLKRGELHTAVLELVINLKQNLDLVFPPINAPLIMFKHVKNLCLPCKLLFSCVRPYSDMFSGHIRFNITVI
jgi:RNA polymerase I-specific transcription initiation factor RRN7